MNFVIRDEKGAGLLDYIQQVAFLDEETGKTVVRRIFDTLPGVELADFTYLRCLTRN